MAVAVLYVTGWWCRCGSRPVCRTLAEHASDVTRWQASRRARHTWRVLREPPRNGWPDALASTYRAIAEVTVTRLIVNTSKFDSDAALLTHLDGIEPAMQGR